MVRHFRSIGSAGMRYRLLSMIRNDIHYPTLLVQSHTLVRNLSVVPPLLLSLRLKGTNPPLKKSLKIPKIYAKMFGSFH